MILDQATLILVGVLVLAVALGGSIIALLRRSQRLTREKLERMSQGLGRLEANVPLAATHQGVAFSLLWSEGASLSVTLATSSREVFSLTRQSLVSRLFRRIGLSTASRTRDAAFDEEFSVDSESPAFVQELLGTPERRRAVRDVFAAGFTEISQGGGELTATRPVTFNAPPLVEPSTIQAVALHLAALAAGEPAVPTMAPSEAPTLSGRRLVWIMVWAGVLPLALVVAAFALDLWAQAYFRPLDTGAVWIDSLKLAAAGLVLTLVVIVTRVHGTFGAARKVLVSVIPATLSLIFAAHALTLALNAQLDRSTPTSHVARVVDKYTSGRARRTFVTIASWRPPTYFDDLPVTREDFDQIVPKTTSVFVRTGAGRFGHEWLVEAHLATFAEILAVHDAAVQARPRDDSVYYNRGVLYLDAGEWARAIDDFRKTIELNPRHARAYRELGWAYDKTGESQKAIEAFTALLEIAPLTKHAYFMRGLNRDKLNDRAGAIADIAHSCQLGYAPACLAEAKQRMTRQPD
jgi:hypothetical protein